MTGLLLAALVSTLPSSGPERFAVVLGTNEGSPGDEPLRFAEADAVRVAGALTDVGGVESAHIRLLTGVDASTLETALRDVAAQLKQRARGGDELVVYISGHADDENLHLQGTLFPLRRLRDELVRAPVDVALLILDTCQSGSLTRVKGLKPLGGPAVHIESAGLKGRVIVSASGPDEYAQESDQLGASYFTYHWVTGLRGPADSSHDGRVTLQEAYDYAYARTVESTFANPAGIQHPNFLVDLKGEGDLVLSETAGPKTHLLIAVEAPGEWLVFSDDGSTLVGRFQKGPGPATFALSPGAYRVRTRTLTGYFEGRVAVSGGAYSVVREADLTAHVSDAVALKAASAPWWVGIAVAGGPPLVSAASWLVGGELVVERHIALVGPFDVLLASAKFSASTPGLGAISENETDLRVGIGTSARRGAWTALLAAELGGLGVYQSRVPGGPRFGGEGLAGARGEVALRLPWGAPFLFLDGAAVLMRTEPGRSVGWTAAAGLGYEFPL